jgi:CBS domain-containing protein
MSLREIARTEVVTTEPSATLVDVARKLDAEDVGSAVVVEDDAPVGIVTDRDVAIRSVAAGSDPTELTAADVMTDDPATVPMDAGVMEVCDAMAAAAVRRMPVVEDGRLAGIVTLDDLMVLLSTEMLDLATVVEAESPPY